MSSWNKYKMETLTVISSRNKALSIFAGNHDSAYFDPSASTNIRVFCRFFLHSEHRKGRPTWTRRMHRHVRKTGKRSVGQTTEWVKKEKKKYASHGSTSNVILTSPAINWLGRTSIFAVISLVFEQVIYSELHCKSLLLHCLIDVLLCISTLAWGSPSETLGGLSFQRTISLADVETVTLYKIWKIECRFDLYRFSIATSVMFLSSVTQKIPLRDNLIELCLNSELLYNANGFI